MKLSCSLRKMCVSSAKSFISVGLSTFENFRPCIAWDERIRLASDSIAILNKRITVTRYGIPNMCDRVKQTCATCRTLEGYHVTQRQRNKGVYCGGSTIGYIANVFVSLNI